MKSRRTTHLWKILAGIMLCSLVASATLWALPDSTIRSGEAGTLRARATAARSCAPIDSTPELFAQGPSAVSEAYVLRPQVLACPEASWRIVQQIVPTGSRARAPPPFSLI